LVGGGGDLAVGRRVRWWWRRRRLQETKIWTKAVGGAVGDGGIKKKIVRTSLYIIIILS